MIKLVFGLASLRTLISFQRVVVACRHESRLQAPLLGLSLAQVGCSPLEGFITAPCSLGCLDYTPRPALSLTLWATNLLGEISFSLCTRSILILCLCAEPTPKYNFIQVFWCCCWSKLGLRAGRSLGWGGDTWFVLMQKSSPIDHVLHVLHHILDFYCKQFFHENSKLFTSSPPHTWHVAPFSTT